MEKVKTKFINESLIFAKLLIGLKICWARWPQTHQRKLKYHGA